MNRASLSAYLTSLSRLCVEVAATPALLPSFLRLIAMASATIGQLVQDAQPAVDSQEHRVPRGGKIRQLYMKPKAAFTFLLRCALLLSTLYATNAEQQIAGDTRITAVVRENSGITSVAVRNDSGIALAAVAVSVTRKIEPPFSPPLAGYPNSSIVRFYSDSLVDGAVALAPGEERVVGQTFHGIAAAKSPRGMSRAYMVFAEPIVTAGIFADGSTAGNPLLVNMILMRRSNMLLAIDTALEVLSEAGKHNVPPSWLVEQFRRLSLSRFYLSKEQEVGRPLYESVLGKLINLPDQPLGSPFPPTAFVEDETVQLRQRRVALVESLPNLEDVARNGR